MKGLRAELCRRVQNLCECAKNIYKKLERAEMGENQPHSIVSRDLSGMKGGS